MYFATTGAKAHNLLNAPPSFFGAPALLRKSLGPSQNCHHNAISSQNATPRAVPNPLRIIHPSTVENDYQWLPLQVVENLS